MDTLAAISARLAALAQALTLARKGPTVEGRRAALLEASGFFRPGSAIRAELQAKARGEPTLAQYGPPMGTAPEKLSPYLGKGRRPLNGA